MDEICPSITYPSGVPQSWLGGTPVLARGCLSLSQGVPSPRQGVPHYWVPPWPEQDGVPQPGQDGYPPGQDGVPSPGSVVPPAWDWGTPHLGLGYPCWKGHGTSHWGTPLGSLGPPLQQYEVIMPLGGLLGT